MQFFPDILSSDDAYCEVTNAFCFDFDTIFAVLEARSDSRELRACALFNIDLRSDTVAYNVLHEIPTGALDYHAEHPNQHYMLVSPGYIHEISDGDIKYFDEASESLLMYLTRVSSTSIAVFGEEGEIYTFESGRYQRIPSGTEEDLYGIHFPSPNSGFAVGDYGTLLKGTGKRLAPVEIGVGDSLRAVHAKLDGTVLIAGIEGSALVLAGEELVEVSGGEGDFYTVTEFQGMEYWGDDAFGVYTRSNRKLVRKFATRYAFNLNATESILTINGGYDIYIFNGIKWKRIKISSSMDSLITPAALDFVPL